MHTFLAFLHIGRVECVTAQVPSSHSIGGGVKFTEDGRVGLYLSGERRVIEVVIADVGASIDLDASAVIAVPPGDPPGTTVELAAVAAGSAIFRGACDRQCGKKKS